MDIEIEDAVETLAMALEKFHLLHPLDQNKLIGQLDRIQELASLAFRRKDDMLAAKRARASMAAAERKKEKENIVPEWVAANINPGTVVRVKTASRTKFRQIISVGNDSIRGQHCNYIKYRAPDGVIRQKLVMGDYITDHLSVYIQAVVTELGERGQPILTPIMDLVSQ